MGLMADAPEHGLDEGQLRARVVELEHELRLRMGDVNRLDRELRHTRADVTVKDEFIAQLSREADKLQSIRDLMGRLPFGLRITSLVDRRIGARPDAHGESVVRSRKVEPVEVGRRRSEARRAVGRLAPHGTTRARAVNAALGVVHGTSRNSTSRNSMRPPGS